ncbi:MAG: Ubiquinone/menaquinone biosynthesis methyltransferase family protein, partial [uncultured Acetobacteraceae bacterium]
CRWFQDRTDRRGRRWRARSRTGRSPATTPRPPSGAASSATSSTAPPPITTASTACSRSGPGAGTGAKRSAAPGWREANACWTWRWAPAWSPPKPRACWATRPPSPAWTSAKGCWPRRGGGSATASGSCRRARKPCRSPTVAWISSAWATPCATSPTSAWPSRSTGASCVPAAGCCCWRSGGRKGGSPRPRSRPISAASCPRSAAGPRRAGAPASSWTTTGTPSRPASRLKPSCATSAARTSPMSAATRRSACSRPIPAAGRSLTTTRP